MECRTLSQRCGRLFFPIFLFRVGFTLMYMASLMALAILCPSTSQLLTSELQHLERPLMQWKYPRWAINKVLQNQQHQQKDTKNKRHIPSLIKKKCHIVVPYAHSTCESFKTICQKYGVQVHFQGGTNVENLLLSPKYKDTITKKSSVIYWFKCDRIDCEDEYIGEYNLWGKIYRTFEGTITHF